jgi:hypothetical protein
MGLIRGGCAVQPGERHLEASAHWGLALQRTNRKNNRISEAVSDADTGQEVVKH